MTISDAHFAQHLHAVPTSPTLAMSAVAQARRAAGEVSYCFGFGQSPFPAPPTVIAALQHHSSQKHYTPVSGLPELRQAIAGFHLQREQLELSPERMLIGAGSKVLIYCVLKAFKQAEVYLPSPSWVSYAPQANLLGHDVHWLPTDFASQWSLLPEQLAAALQQNSASQLPKVLILNSPNNPSGMTYSSSQLQTLAAIARRYNMLVISDEIYGQLHYSGEHESIAQYYPEATIVTNGLSKWCALGGWRLGFAHIPTALGNEFMDTVVGIASETYSCAATPIQYAAVSAYQLLTQDPDHYISRQRAVLSQLATVLCQQMQAADIQVHMPHGGFYCMLGFAAYREALERRGIMTDTQLCQQLAHDTGVMLLPASAFGLAAEHLAARLAFVDFDGEGALNDPNLAVDDYGLHAQEGVA